jgi:hypothetical protein
MGNHNSYSDNFRFLLRMLSDLRRSAQGHRNDDRRKLIDGGRCGRWDCRWSRQPRQAHADFRASRDESHKAEPPGAHRVLLEAKTSSFQTSG